MVAYNSLVNIELSALDYSRMDQIEFVFLCIKEDLLQFGDRLSNIFLSLDSCNHKNPILDNLLEPHDFQDKNSHMLPLIYIE